MFSPIQAARTEQTPPRRRLRAVCAIWALEPRRMLAGFNIEFSIDPDSDVGGLRAAVLAAGARWERILTEDIPDVPGGPWGKAVDDLRINVSADTIDGPGKILGYAEPHYRRSNGTGLPIDGLLHIDIDDVNNPRLLDIATHEIGHVLGIGSLWSGALVPGTGGADPEFLGTAALREYRALAGDATLAGVPVENTGNPGTRDVHWREATFFNELMTGFYNSSVIDPLSRISAASLIDLGYPGVSLDGADPYNVPNGNPIPTIASLTAPATVPLGGSVTLLANNVADFSIGNVPAVVTAVRFYHETNGIPGLQAAGNELVPDTLAATSTSGAPWQTTLDLSALPTGSYTFYAQATDTNGAVSAFATASTVIALPAPSVPRIDAASDSGVSDHDGITNNNRPTFLGTGADGATVHLIIDGVEVGQAAVVNGTWTFTPTTPLSDRVHPVSAFATFGSATSATSAAAMIKIDTLAPRVLRAAFDDTHAIDAVFTFDDIMGPLHASDVTFFNTTTGATFPARIDSINPGGITTLASFALDAAHPTAGRYVATMNLAGATDLAGNAVGGSAVVAFDYLPGDIDHSGRVDFADLLTIAQHYGATSGLLADGDLDYSGTVDFNDLLTLARNYGTMLPAPMPAARAKTRTTVASALLK